MSGTRAKQSDCNFFCPQTWIVAFRLPNDFLMAMRMSLAGPASKLQPLAIVRAAYSRSAIPARHWKCRAAEQREVTVTLYQKTAQLL
jgi:hypothetical protein